MPIRKNFSVYVDGDYYSESSAPIDVLYDEYATIDEEELDIKERFYEYDWHKLGFDYEIRNFRGVTIVEIHQDVSDETFLKNLEMLSSKIKDKQFLVRFGNKRSFIKNRDLKDYHYRYWHIVDTNRPMGDQIISSFMIHYQGKNTPAIASYLKLYRNDRATTLRQEKIDNFKRYTIKKSLEEDDEWQESELLKCDPETIEIYYEELIEYKSNKGLDIKDEKQKLDELINKRVSKTQSYDWVNDEKNFEQYLDKKEERDSTRAGFFSRPITKIGNNETEPHNPYDSITRDVFSFDRLSYNNIILFDELVYECGLKLGIEDEARHNLSKKYSNIDPLFVFDDDPDLTPEYLKDLNEEIKKIKDQIKQKDIEFEAIERVREKQDSDYSEKARVKYYLVGASEISYSKRDDIKVLDGERELYEAELNTIKREITNKIFDEICAKRREKTFEEANKEAYKYINVRKKERENLLKMAKEFHANTLKGNGEMF